MTFTEMVTNVMNDLNLSGSAATARVGANINKAYRRVISSCGLDYVQTVVDVQVTTVIGNRSLVWSPSTTTPSTGVEKILVIRNPVTNPAWVLTEVLLDDLRNQIVGSDPPQQYAIQTISSNSVTVMLDCVPATNYNLLADVLSNVTSLSGSQTPNFPEDFHDCLEHYARARELKKLEKSSDADDEMKEFKTRRDELAWYLAKSAYKDIYQGKTSGFSETLTMPLV